MSLRFIFFWATELRKWALPLMKPGSEVDWPFSVTGGESSSPRLEEKASGPHASNTLAWPANGAGKAVDRRRESRKDKGEHTNQSRKEDGTALSDMVVSPLVIITPEESYKQNAAIAATRWRLQDPGRTVTAYRLYSSIYASKRQTGFSSTMTCPVELNSPGPLTFCV